jgi:hypothetical protein
MIAPTTTTARKPNIHGRLLGFRRSDDGGRYGASDAGVELAGVLSSSGVTIPSEVSALLLTVVILGLCVAAVVADLVGGPEQPATVSPRHHREYAGPWRNWLLALRGLVQRTVGRVQRGLGIASTKLQGWGRQLYAASRETVEAARESMQGVAARRRAATERQLAHARHVAHVEEVTESPEPYPLPPPLHELEEHEERLRKEKEQREVAAQAFVATPPPPPAGGAGTTTMLRERVAQAVPVSSRHAVLPAPPLGTRIRSALMLVILMSALGAVVTGIFLGVVFLLVHALSSV